MRASRETAYRLGIGWKDKVRAQVEKSVLAGLPAESSGFDEAMGNIEFTSAVRASLSLPSEYVLEDDYGTASRSNMSF